MTTPEMSNMFSEIYLEPMTWRQGNFIRWFTHDIRRTDFLLFIKASSD